MTKPPLTLADDALSHEPDFSFRNPKPRDRFAFDPNSTVDLDAVAHLSPVAPAPSPATQPVPVPVSQPNIIDTQPITPALPTQPVHATPPAVVQVRPAPFSGMSLASFILALIGIVTPFLALPVVFSLLAVILGHVGSYRSRKHGLTGAGYAAAGMTIGYATLVITAIVAIVIIVIAVLTGNLIEYFNSLLSK